MSDEGNVILTAPVQPSLLTMIAAATMLIWGQVPEPVADAAARSWEKGGFQAAAVVLAAVAVWLGYRERSATAELRQLTKDTQALALKAVEAIAGFKATTDGNASKTVELITEVRRLADKLG